MKYVYPTEKIAHMWYNGSVESAANPQKNLYYRNGVIYSYRDSFPIAAHRFHEDKSRCVLITTRTYSNTTARHIGRVTLSVPCRAQPTFHVDDVLADTLQAHTENIQGMMNRANQCRVDAIKSRKYADALRADALTYEDAAREYATFFNVRFSNFPTA